MYKLMTPRLEPHTLKGHYNQAYERDISLFPQNVV